MARFPTSAPSRRPARSNHNFAPHAVCRLHSCGALACLRRTGRGRLRAVSRLAWAAIAHLSNAAQLIRVLGDDGVPVEWPGLRPDRSATSAHSSYAVRPVFETACLARRADKLRRYSCADRLGFYIDLPAAFHNCRKLPRSPVTARALPSIEKHNSRKCGGGKSGGLPTGLPRLRIGTFFFLAIKTLIRRHRRSANSDGRAGSWVANPPLFPP